MQVALSSSKNVDKIGKGIDSFVWEKHFTNIREHEKVTLLNQIIKNIISSYIRIFDDKDPPWINKTKRLIENNNKRQPNVAAVLDPPLTTTATTKAYKNYIQNNKNDYCFQQFHSTRNYLSVMTENLRNKYYARIPSKQVYCKTSYWKTSLSNKRIPCVSPRFHQSKLIT